MKEKELRKNMSKQTLKKNSTGNLQKIVLFTLALVILLIFFAYLERDLFRQMQAPSRPLEVYQSVPHFNLTDQHGNAVALTDLKGHVWVADFIFTTCPAACNTMTTRMSELQTTLRKTPEVKLVSFTVDPEYDTPEILRAFSARFLADPKRWYFLTGPSEEIQKIAREGFLLSFVENPKEEIPKLGRYTHSTKFALVDTHGVVRAYHDGMDEQALNEIVRDIGILLREGERR